MKHRFLQRRHSAGPGKGRANRRERMTCESRYRHKLNMLWPGQVMFRIIGVLLLAGILFRLLEWCALAMAAFALAGAVLAILLILVAIELHQDSVLNRIAMLEHEERESRD